MKVVNMKMPAENDGDEAQAPDAKEHYPFGLSLMLDDDVIDKLDLGSLPSVGDTINVAAKAKVESVSQRQDTDDDGPNRSITLQITDMGLENDDENDHAEKLFGSSENS